MYWHFWLPTSDVEIGTLGSKRRECSCSDEISNLLFLMLRSKHPKWLCFVLMFPTSDFQCRDRNIEIRASRLVMFCFDVANFQLSTFNLWYLLILYYSTIPPLLPCSYAIASFDIIQYLWGNSLSHFMCHLMWWMV